MAFNLALFTCGEGVDFRLFHFVARLAVAVSAPWLLSAATAEPAAEWQPDVRSVLLGWPRALSIEERVALVDALAIVAGAHPLVLAPLWPDIRSAEAPVRARLLTAFSDAGYPESAAEGKSALLDPDPGLSIAAAAVLARWAPPDVRDTLVAIWHRAEPPPPELAEAVTAAMARAVSSDELAELHQSPVAGVRRAALDALGRQRSVACRVFLRDTLLADLAAGILYDQRLEGAWSELAEAACRTESPLSSTGRERGMAAAWHLGGQARADQLAAWLAARPLTDTTSEAAAPAARAAWRALILWDTPPAADPVLPHRPFLPRPRPAAEAWPALTHHADALERWAASLGPDAAAAWTQWRTHLTRMPRDQTAWASFLADRSKPEGQRVFLLRQHLSNVHSDLDLTALASAALTAPEAPTLRSEARAWLFLRKGPGSVNWLLQSLADATAPEKQAAIRLLDQHATPESDAYLLRLLEQAKMNLVDPAIIPELVEAAGRRVRFEGPQGRVLRAALDAWRGTQPPSLGDPLRPWRPALQHGDSEAGRALFFSDFARCSRCHHPSSTTPSLSPSLAGIGSRLDGPALLESLVLPADPATRKTDASPPHGGCRPMGTLLTLRELRDLVSYLRSIP